MFAQSPFNEHWPKPYKTPLTPAYKITYKILLDLPIAILYVSVLCIVLSDHTGHKHGSGNENQTKGETILKPENPFQTVIRRARKGSIEHFTDGGILYVRRYVACGKKLCSRCTIEDSNSRRPSHGPYWYMIAWNPVKKREYLLYIGKELDTKKYRTETGLIDWPAYFSIKARGKFPNTPSGPPSSGLTPDEGPQPTPEGEPPCNATE